MLPTRVKIVWLFIGILLFMSSAYSQVISPQHAKKPFTVADDIEASLLLPQADGATVRFSPDGNYFAVYSERGRLDMNKVEDSLRFYRSQDVENFLGHPNESQPPLPSWVVNRTYKKGPVISEWHWLADSSGVAFLEPAADGNYHLVLADFRRRTLEPLTSTTEKLGEYALFDVRDRDHYVYTAVNPLESKKLQKERQAELYGPATVGTGRHLNELLFPEDPGTRRMRASSEASLWAVIRKRRFEVRQGSVPLVPQYGLALSPDGRSVITTQRVSNVPSSWETLYPPPHASSIYSIRDSASQFVRVGLETGEVQSLTNAPVSRDAGWFAQGDPDWSSDGQAVLLPGTFSKSKDNAPSRPCVAVVDSTSNTHSCVETLKSVKETAPEGSYHHVFDARFVGGDKNLVRLTFWHVDWTIGTVEYRHSPDGTWQALGEGVPEEGHGGLQVRVEQDINKPPLLVASKKDKSRVIWNPNPRLESIELGDASVYTWKDKEGKEQKGGLYKPPNYKTGQRYPLVLQTHGYIDEQFLPSGTGFGPAYAARALAAAGIVVLQLGEDCPFGISEGPCAVSGYEAAAERLAADGLIDPQKIGIIGFSRTCFYVMQALTTGSSLHLKAASITDGVMETYFEYMLDPEGSAHETNPMIGGEPFGAGLQQWLKRSPGFNLDKVATPLLVNTEGRGGLLLEMWEPYAGLHYLHKPVDLIILNTDEHTLTNPAVRMASQGGSVDWFRFWLQDYEDPDPAKTEQYKRWRGLRKLQEENERKSNGTQASTTSTN